MIMSLSVTPEQLAQGRFRTSLNVVSYSRTHKHIMTSQSVPACLECKHYYTEMDIPFCKFHYFEKANYVTGTIHKMDILCVEARKDKKLCGHEGKNFEQREESYEEEVMSFWEAVKGFFTHQWL